ncbi:hypothetical protein OG272_43460 [Streptomyces sp. NBC_00104]|uniref:hypothetical protein n=1 Tax=Streptomyces sp. NBC_00104 TaxID=2903621 RepID=UPI00324CABAA
MTEASGEPPVPERSDVPRRVRDPEARRTLEAWLARTGTVLSYAGWEDAGNSGAQVFAVYARRRHEGRLTDARKLVVKVLPPRASSVREPQRHARAEELSTPTSSSAVSHGSCPTIRPNPSAATAGSCSRRSRAAV